MTVETGYPLSNRSIGLLHGLFGPSYPWLAMWSSHGSSTCAGTHEPLVEGRGTCREQQPWETGKYPGACPRRRSDAGFRWSMPIYITNYWAWIGINSSIPALNERTYGKNPSPSCLGVYLLFILIAKPRLTKNPSYLINSTRKKTKSQPRPLLNKDFGKQTWLWMNHNLFNPFYERNDAKKPV